MRPIGQELSHELSHGTSIRKFLRQDVLGPEVGSVQISRQDLFTIADMEPAPPAIGPRRGPRGKHARRAAAWNAMSRDHHYA
jgi:hypothetical protein